MIDFSVYVSTAHCKNGVRNKTIHTQNTSVYTYIGREITSNI